MSANNDQAIQEIHKRAEKLKHIVFVCGNFNIVHPGHLRLLRFASECGNFLVVGVHDNSSPGVMLPDALRLEGVQAISFVDYAFILREPAVDFITRLRPDFVVMGKEHEYCSDAEKNAVAAYGGKLLFSSGEARFSSLHLLHREYIETRYSQIYKPKEYPARHGFELQDLKRVLHKMIGLKVLVIGDLIVDEYITCDPLGISQEDPTIVVTPIESMRFVGGAGIVAAHAQGLGAEVKFLSISGKDDAAHFAESKLSSYGVHYKLLCDESRPTTLKQRYRASGKTLLRVSHLRQHAISSELADQLLELARSAMTDCDLLVFSDFNYGCLPQGLVDDIIASGHERGIMMVADSQASSQISDISRFTGMTLLTPTEREARLALRDSDCGLAVLAQGIVNQACAKNVIITLGSEGLLVIAKDINWVTDLLPAFNAAPKDTAGAGDSLLICTSMAMCAGADTWSSAYLGSIAAGCQVARVGNTPLTQSDLLAEIDIF
ncbi:MAG: ADP-heptose synthase [Methylococcaceae bacterium]|nr:MAG: ADP-heptose synthase [Methylococcaceae bacterium]